MRRRPKPVPKFLLLFCGLMTGLCSGLFTSLFAAEARAEEVTLELLLAVDCSSSVDRREYELQVRGLADAFRDPRVLQALEGTGPRGIAVALLQWSGHQKQERVIDWTHLTDAASAEAFAAEIEAMPRLVIGGPTAIGSAVLEGIAWLNGNGFQGERRAIDVSGDGRANQGIAPSFARSAAVAEQITINGLAILNEEPNLGQYYASGVIGGPGAFLLTAEDSEDFAQAIRRKLFYEISGPPVAEMAPDPSLPGALQKARRPGDR